MRAELRKGAKPVDGKKATEQAEPSTERAGQLKELAELQKKLAQLQGDAPLVLPSVDEHAVASVVQDWTGIPVGRMVKNEVENVLQLADTLNKRVIGQKHALEMIARRIQTPQGREFAAKLAVGDAVQLGYVEVLALEVDEIK